MPIETTTECKKTCGRDELFLINGQVVHHYLCNALLRVNDKGEIYCPYCPKETREPRGYRK